MGIGPGRRRERMGNHQDSMQGSRVVMCLGSRLGWTLVMANHQLYMNNNDHHTNDEAG